MRGGPQFRPLGDVLILFRRDWRGNAIRMEKGLQKFSLNPL